MDFRKPKILIRPTPEDGESLVGHLLRVTEANGYESIYWLLNACNLQTAARIHSCIYRAEDMETLAGMLCVGSDDIQRMSGIPSGEFTKRNKINYEVCGQVVSSTIFRPSFPKICPECLAEKPFCRKIWELGVVTSCIKHKCILLRECPGCGETLTWKRKKVCVCPCGLDWRTVTSGRLPEAELLFSARAANLLGVLDILPPEFPSVLIHLDLMDLANLLFFICGELRGRGDVFGKSLQIQLTNAELNAELSFALRIFEDFPFKFFDALDQLDKIHEKRKEKYVFQKRPAEARRRILGSVIRTCTKVLKGKEFDFLRSAFQEFYDYAKLESCGIAQPPRSELRATEFFKIHLPLSHAFKPLGIAKNGIRQMVELGAIRGVHGNGNGKELWYVNKEDIAVIKKEMDESISGTAAATTLGIWALQFASLLKAGVLKEINAPYMRGQVKNLVSRSEVNSIYGRFCDASANRKEIPSGETYLAEQVAYRLNHRGVDFGEMVKLVLTGAIVPVSTPEGGTLQSVLYSKAEIDEYCKLLVEKQKGGTYSEQETADLLGTSVKVVTKLTKLGYLKRVAHQAKAIRSRLSYDSVNSFQKSYVVLTQLSRELGESPIALLSRLTTRKIEPIDTRLGPWCLLYKRSAIARIKKLK